MREHDVAALSAAELEAARRELAASLALARPGSPVRAPIQARMAAIEAELAGRAAARPGLPGSPAYRVPGRRACELRKTPRYPGAGASSRLGQRHYRDPRDLSMRRIRGPLAGECIRAPV